MHAFLTVFGIRIIAQIARQYDNVHDVSFNLEFVIEYGFLWFSVQKQVDISAPFPPSHPDTGPIAIIMGFGREYDIGQDQYVMIAADSAACYRQIQLLVFYHFFDLLMPPVSFCAWEAP